MPSYLVFLCTALVPQGRNSVPAQNNNANLIYIEMFEKIAGESYATYSASIQSPNKRRPFSVELHQNTEQLIPESVWKLRYITRTKIKKKNEWRIDQQKLGPCETGTVLFVTSGLEWSGCKNVIFIQNFSWATFMTLLNSYFVSRIPIVDSRNVFHALKAILSTVFC